MAGVPTFSTRPSFLGTANEAHRERFLAVVQRGFSQRRKKLSNLLPTQDDRRAEHLTPVEWVELWRQVEAARANGTGGC